MKTAITTIATLFVFAATNALAYEEDPHPLDVQLADCISGRGTIGVRSCYGEFEDRWDAELNKYYQLLRKGQARRPGWNEALRASQRAWIKFRDLDFEYLETQYGDMDGSMYPRIIAQKRMVIVRHRALELQDYYRTLSTML